METSEVKWNNRIINLDTEDTKIRTRYRQGLPYDQYPVAHEFGHTIGNSYYALNGTGYNVHGDEYSADYRVNGGFKLDYLSIMNIGNQLRNRHLDYILIQLNSMFFNTTFYIV